MFTGIIEETGSIGTINRGNVSASLVIHAKKVLENVHIGDSIAVNGICLTVTSFTESTFTVDMMHETINCTCAAEWKNGTKVNLERAMSAEGRFGGHIVAGHVDGTGTIRKTWEDENAVWYEIETSPEITHYIVEKGSITIDGISLTVAYVEGNVFRVSVIPHTRKVTNLSDKRAGNIVNLENDIIGKYVEKMLTPWAGNKGEGKKESSLTEKTLLENGFM